MKEYQKPLVMVWEWQVDESLATVIQSEATVEDNDLTV